MNNPISAFKALVSSVGMDALSEKIRENTKKAYNDKKIHDDLDTYIAQKTEGYFNVDMTEEIDFENLQNYISNELHEDFQACLFGDRDQRNAKKERIINCLYEHTYANTEKRKMYVKNIFDSAYAIIGNFYYNNLPKREDIFLANKITEEICNEMQKLSDQLTEQILSINNNAIPSYINQNYINSTADGIHKMVVNKFIKKRYSDFRSTLKYNDYSALFKKFVYVTDEDMRKIDVDNLFEFVKDKIDAFENEDFIKISGPDGTGKSTFLSLLYLYLYSCYCRGEISIYPFYINLHYYDRTIIDNTGRIKGDQEIRSSVAEDIQPLIELSKNSSNGILVIIDGNESYFRTTLRTGIVLKDIVRGIVGHKKIICIGEKTNVHAYRERKEVIYLDGSTNYEFNFRTICVDDSQLYKELKLPTPFGVLKP